MGACRCNRFGCRAYLLRNFALSKLREEKLLMLRTAQSTQAFKAIRLSLTTIILTILAQPVWATRSGRYFQPNLLMFARSDTKGFFLGHAEISNQHDLSRTETRFFIRVTFI